MCIYIYVYINTPHLCIHIKLSPTIYKLCISKDSKSMRCKREMWKWRKPQMGRF